MFFIYDGKVYIIYVIISIIFMYLSCYVQSKANQLYMYDFASDCDEETTIYNDSKYKSHLLFFQSVLIVVSEWN